LKQENLALIENQGKEPDQRARWHPSQFFKSIFSEIKKQIEPKKVQDEEAYRKKIEWGTPF